MAKLPEGRYCKVVAKATGDVIAYLDRQDNDEHMHDEGNLFMHEVYDLWTAPDGEAETYAMAFDCVPIVHASDIAVISLGWSMADRPESDKGPWLWEPRKLRFNNSRFKQLVGKIHGNSD